MKMILMPFSEEYKIKDSGIIFHYKNILCLNESDINNISDEYNFIFYHTKKRIYFDYGGLKKVIDKYKIKDWLYNVKKDYILHILAIEKQTKQTTIIEINIRNCSYSEKAINISSDEIENRHYFLIYNGEEVCISIFDYKTKESSFYSYNKDTYGLNIRDISITGVIRYFDYICNYKNRMIIKLHGKNIKITDNNICYLSYKKRLSIFLDICFDKKTNKKTISIINNKGIDRDTYIEEWNFKKNKLIFSENPYKEGDASGLEKYYSYDVKKRQLKEMYVGNKVLPCIWHGDLYVSNYYDDSEILRLSDMKIIYKEDIFNAVKKFNQKLSCIIPDYNADEEIEHFSKFNATEWCYHDCFIEAHGTQGQTILIEVDTMKPHSIGEYIVDIIDDTVYILESPSYNGFYEVFEKKFKHYEKF